MTTARLVVAVISTTLEEIAIWAIWRWGLPEIGVNLPVSALIGVMVAWGVFSTVNFIFVTRALRRPGSFGPPTMVGARGKAASPLNPDGLVKIKGELWSAVAENGPVTKGEEITVVGENGLKLLVRRSGSHEK